MAIGEHSRACAILVARARIPQKWKPVLRPEYTQEFLPWSVFLRLTGFHLAGKCSGHKMHRSKQTQNDNAGAKARVIGIKSAKKISAARADLHRDRHGRRRH